MTATAATAQQIYLEGGKTLSSFDFKNSQGERLDNLQATPNSFMAFGYKSQLFTKKLNISLGTSYEGYGARGSEDTFGNFMEWDVNYAGLNLGLDYDLFSIKKAIIYLKAGTSAELLVQGTQTFNDTVIDLKNNEEFDITKIGMNAGVGIEHPVSDNLSFYVQYLYGESLDMSKGDETLKIKSNNLSFGLLINISKKQTKETEK